MKNHEVQNGNRLNAKNILSGVALFTAGVAGGGIASHELSQSNNQQPAQKSAVSPSSTNLKQEEVAISKDIAQHIPVHYLSEVSATIQKNGEDINIYDPLKVGKYIGAILDKGGPGGPEVQLYLERDAQLLPSKSPNPDRNIVEASVVFSQSNGEPWNLSNPVNQNGKKITEQGRTPLIGSISPY